MSTTLAQAFSLVRCCLEEQLAFYVSRSTERTVQFCKVKLRKHAFVASPKSEISYQQDSLPKWHVKVSNAGSKRRIVWDIMGIHTASLETLIMYVKIVSFNRVFGIDEASSTVDHCVNRLSRICSRNHLENHCRGCRNGWNVIVRESLSSELWILKIESRQFTILVHT